MKLITNDGVANNVGVNHSSQRSNARRTGTGVNVRRRNVVDRTHSNCASVTHVSPPADSNSQGVDMILEMDFVCFAIQETEIQSLMIQIRILSIILKIFPTTLHNPSSIIQETEIQETYSCELCGNDAHYGYDFPPQVPIGGAGRINSPSWNRPAFYDDDDDNEYTIQYWEYLENLSNAITPDLPTEEPDNSLSMGDEHLSSIPETKSNEVIKSSVEDLVPIPSESKGISNDTCDVPFCDNYPPLDVLSDHFEIFFDFNNDCTSSDDDSFEDIDYIEASPPDSELVNLEEVKDDILHEKLLNINLLIACDLPSSDDFSPISIFEEKFVTFSNPLFDSNDDFTSSNNNSLSDEDVPEDVKIYSNPLFEFDDEYISSDVNPLFEEVLEDIECKDSYDSNLDESTLLVTPLFDSNEDECLASRGDIDEINAFLDVDISTDIEDGYHDLERDIIYLESLLSNDTIPNLPPEVFLDHEPRSNDKSQKDKNKAKTDKAEHGNGMSAKKPKPKACPSSMDQPGPN
ncbi:hypothetical protein Tco_0898515 [Tanacetum coccineum]